ncbi:IS110 family transposase [Rasiella sp. SM2506]|uniref:IS110 family transposase n=1 Tax=Rasiella sp. SM2506 TaxID=3423914 RepID=UPI003D7A351B
MNKNTIFVGIDISKDVFDVYSPEEGHRQFTNNVYGFKSFVKTLTPSHWCIMEATACYHYQLSLYIFEKGHRVSVMNPLIIKRYIQMKLNQIKTDKSDAKMICQYGQEQSLLLWHPDPEYVEECKMLQTVTQLYFKQTTAIKNKLHSLGSKGHTKGLMIRSLKRQLKQLQKEINLLETQMELLIKTHEPELFTIITSIPGIGKKTAMLLIITTNSFKDFESCKQISSFLGLAPNERSSGSSVRGRSRISKTGNPIVRNHLFLCSFTASIHNPQCKALYERIVAKGKSKKLALIAVCNKLIKQAYGISKSRIPYDKNYVSKLN